ncbi:uncharacterized protein [Fopius arisanus]|uniref:Uncharacterized protein n=1 Tax=Fopius arisanus TaxID=64838 RepID=A0A9R1T8L1_9HYME|nr:PREDICTED: uncharacterized protein LOC105267450 [Fopius arisanus]
MSGMSGTILTSKINSSCVSSNGYYGYVPPISDFTQSPGKIYHPRGENSSGVCVDVHRNPGNALEGYQDQDYYTDTVGMEMDTDENCSGMGMCRNNHYVIPEMVDGGKESMDGFGAMGFCRNTSRKRHWTDRVIAGREENGKRFKTGGGNSRVEHDARCSREPRSSQVHDDSSSLYLTHQKVALTWHSKLTSDSCKQTAGKPHNYRFITETINYEKPKDRFTYGHEYETMLMETHGCSVYHHQRQLDFDNGIIETEF